MLDRKKKRKEIIKIKYVYCKGFEIGYSSWGIIVVN